MQERNLSNHEQGDNYLGGSHQSNEGGYGANYGRGRSNFGGARPFRPAPVKVGEEFDVKIESMSKRGDAGVAKVEGLVIFVAGAKVGDGVRIRITKVGRGYATADISQSPSSSSDSVTDQGSKYGSSSSSEGQDEIK